MTAHELKLHQNFFDAAQNGIKSWEIREDPGRKFKVGDTILFEEYNGFECTGRDFEAMITYILGHEDFSKIPENYVIFSIRVI